MISVRQAGERWVAQAIPFSYEEKDVIKNAGFRWSPDEKLWFTTDPMIAARLDADAAAQVNAAITQSAAASAEIDVPAPAGLTYLDYQKGGIKYALDKPNVLFADEMGLGKTIEAIGVINSDDSIRNVLVVCPASIKINWVRELKKWLVKPRSISIANGQFPASNVVIINYDVLTKWREEINKRKWDLLIVDECHYVKNEKALRTQALLGKRGVGAIAARKRIFMTGTPIVNRPIELWTLVQALDPQGLGRSFWKFAERYTGAIPNGYGHDFSGAFNLEELQQRLRGKFMVRRLKSEVLKDLPAKRRQVIIVPPAGEAALVVQAEQQAFAPHRAAIERAEKAAQEARARGDNDGYVAAVATLHAANHAAFEEMAALRQKTAIAKIPYVIDHLKDILEAEEKVVVFCHHQAVARALKEAFPNAAMATGETKPSDRILEVDRFQVDPSCQLFIGSIMAAGVGLTLTAAQHVVFAELDWVPGNISQAEDRLHRYGQQGSVLVQHLVFDESVDSYMAQMIIDKQAVIEQALNNQGLPLVAPQQVPVTLLQPPVITPVIRDQAISSQIPDDETIPF